VILASGLKYVGLGTTALGWTLCGVLLTAASAWLVRAQPWRRAAAAQPPPQAEPPTSSVADASST